MRFNIKQIHIDTVLGLLILFFSIKLLWVVLEAVWLPAEGVDHHADKRSRPLYYNVRLASAKKTVQPLRPNPVQKPVGSIKDIKLLALYNASDTTVVTIEYKNKTKVLAKGDVVNGFVLEGAGNNFATFSKKGKMYRVDLVKSKRRGEGKIVSAAPASKDESRSPKASPQGEIIDAGDHKIIERTLFDHYLNNIDDIYRNIGIQEIRKDGKQKAFQVTFVKRGGPFEKLGVKRGDILKAVNGAVLDGYSAALEAYRRMKDTQNITLEIERGNKTMELEYEID